MAMHTDQLDLSVDVRAGDWCASSVPRWAGAPVDPVDSTGTVNAIFRIGDAHAAPIPASAAGPGSRPDPARAGRRAARELAACGPVGRPMPAPGALDQDPARSTASPDCRHLRRPCARPTRRPGVPAAPAEAATSGTTTSG